MPTHALISRLTHALLMSPFRRDPLRSVVAHMWAAHRVCEKRPTSSSCCTYRCVHIHVVDHASCRVDPPTVARTANVSKPSRTAPVRRRPQAAVHRAGARRPTPSNCCAHRCVHIHVVDHTNSRVDLPTDARTANAPNPSCACALQLGVARAAVCRACVTRRTSGICCAHRCICAFMWSTMPTDALIWRRSRAPVMLPTRRALLRFVVAPGGGASGRTKPSNLEQLLPAQMRTHSCERPCQLTRSSPDGRVHC